MTRSAARPRHARDTALPGDAAALRDVRITDHDLYLFNEGTHFRLYDKLGAHIRGAGLQPAGKTGGAGLQPAGETGVAFAVWAPSARRVSVVGDFNNWDPAATPMNPRASSGIWEAFVPGLGEGAIYKYRIEAAHSGYIVQKADPLGFAHEVPPKTASVVRGLDYEWHDADWLLGRRERHTLQAPISIYEMHLGSWRRKPEEGNRSLTYRELAEQLPQYLRDRGFTHVELLPVMEHPLYASWGYQTTGYFAPTSRYGSPQDFMHLVDALHQAGIGVILDWVPSHFPSDEHGPGYFDGTHLYEHADPRLGFHPDWKSLIFNYSRHEVRSFLISSALFWLEKYHIDGIRVDAVASMLYRDYSRKAGEWLPNEHGGRENLEAVDFLRRLNTEIYRSFPDVQTFAEESTAWPMVSRPTYIGGLGFGFKWDMGWMHDTLKYLARDPIHRSHHQGEITFRALYQFTENYTLPLSHDEVVHGKGSLAGKLGGGGADAWQKLATLRLLLAYQWSQPGKKLLFMGGELGQWSEWNHDSSLDWHLLETESGEHAGIQRLVDQLNRLYREMPALHEHDCDPAGFQWLDASDASSSVISYLRRAGERTVLCIFNFTPAPRHNYLLGAPAAGRWREILNTDATEFGGSGMGNLGGAETHPLPRHGHPQSLRLTLPPLGALWLEAEEQGD